MKDFKIYIFIASGLLIAYLVAEYNKPQPVNWNPTYLKTDKIPYGTYILYQQLHDLFPNSKVKLSNVHAYNTLKETTVASGNYLFIANKTAINKQDFNELVKYIEKGNQVFIASYSLGKFLSDTLAIEISSQYAKTKIGFTNPSLEPEKKYQFNKDNIGTWYFSKFDTAKAIVLGNNNYGQANFLKYPFGKGTLFLIPDPKLFTNFIILDPQGEEYISKTLSYLDPKEEIIWDEYNILPNDDENSSPMRVFLRHAELRWAYYIALATLFAFVVFESKRRQRIIPIINPLKNTSVEFARVIGQVYYQQRDNQDIAKKKIAYLLEYIRVIYLLKTNLIDQEFCELLIQKSGINAVLINQLMNQIKKINLARQVKDSELIAFNKTIEEFYKQAI